MKEFLGYKCDHCSKLYQKKHACSDHEEICLKNPENYKPCLDSCEFLKRKEIEYYTGFDDYHSGEPVYKKTKGFHCSKLDKLMMHPNMERSNLDISYVYLDSEETEQHKMPCSCPHLKNWQMEIDNLDNIFK